MKGKLSKEEIDECSFRTYNGWEKKGRRVLKGEKAALVSQSEGITVHLFAKHQTTKVNSGSYYGQSYNDRSSYGYDSYDYDYDGGIDSLYGL